MNLRTLPFLVFAVIVIGCSNQHQQSIKIEIIEPQIDSISTLTDCIYPIQMKRFGEMLVVLDAGNQKQCFLEYTLEGELKHRFGNVGRAKNELNNVSNFFKLDEHRLSVYKRDGLVIYNIDSIHNSVCDYEFIPTTANEFYLHDVWIKENEMLYFSNSHNERFSYDNGQGKVLSYNSYPSIHIKNTDDIHAVFNYAPRFDVDVKNNRFCMGTYVGAVLETFYISPDKIELSGYNEIIKPTYKKFNNGAISWDKDTQIGFDDITIGANHIYALLSGAKGEKLIKGEQDSFTDKISVYNWDATLYSEIHVGHNMLCLSVSESKNEVFAICYNKKTGFYLLRITW